MSQDLPEQLTPQQRLARSREAITMELGHDGDDLGAEWGQPILEQQLRPDGKPRSGWWPLFKSLSHTWWHRHPLNAVTHMAKPIIETYARKEPAKLLGAAALVGAAVVLIRPWKLISAGALLAAALRPSEISAFAMTMLSSFNGELQKDRARHRQAGMTGMPRS